MAHGQDEREDALRTLAGQLFFSLERRADGYRLVRHADVPAPVEFAGLSLDEVQETLTVWKLRGPHGG